MKYPVIFYINTTNFITCQVLVARYWLGCPWNNSPPLTTAVGSRQLSAIQVTGNGSYNQILILFENEKFVTTASMGKTINSMFEWTRLPLPHIRDDVSHIAPFALARGTVLDSDYQFLSNLNTSFPDLPWIYYGFLYNNCCKGIYFTAQH